jgi:8-oxo-dGTP pyrophosphatase MutT (NUDIX family)
MTATDLPPPDDQPAPAPRAAATVILLRRDAGGARVLMGMRGAGAVFMPSKYVFPGGAVDPGDGDVPLVAGLGDLCRARLAERATGPSAQALTVAAIRELWEETGLRLGASGGHAPLPPGWSGFDATGTLPTAHALSFFFRAITPPGRSRRFDARFFLADAAGVMGDLDDFGLASDELSHLHWVPLAEARALNLPFITEVVLAELSAHLARAGAEGPLGPPPNVPFFDNSGPVPMFRRLGLGG